MQDSGRREFADVVSVSGKNGNNLADLVRLFVGVGGTD